MVGRIVVIRDPAIIGRTTRFAIRVDARRVGKVRNGASGGYDVEPGVHRVRVSQTGIGSRTLVISVADGETVVLRCHMRFWASFGTGMAGGLVGGNGTWLLLAGPSTFRVVLLALGVAGFVAGYASRALISLRPEPAIGYRH